jgi:hypothetical protein
MAELDNAHESAAGTVDPGSAGGPRCWHIDVAQSNTSVESIDDRVDDRRWRADGTGLTRALDAQWVGR